MVKKVRVKLFVFCPKCCPLNIIDSNQNWNSDCKWRLDNPEEFKVMWSKVKVRLLIWCLLIISQRGILKLSNMARFKVTFLIPKDCPQNA